MGEQGRGRKNFKGQMFDHSLREIAWSCVKIIIVQIVEF